MVHFAVKRKSNGIAWLEYGISICRVYKWTIKYFVIPRKCEVYVHNFKMKFKGHVKYIFLIFVIRRTEQFDRLDFL